MLHDDANRLDQVGNARSDVGIAMHWVSHIPMARWAEFFRALHARLNPGATVLLADDIYRPGDTDPYYSKLEARDSYEIRSLPKGSSYEIVKTYLTPENLSELLKPYAENIEIHFELPTWWMTYQVNPQE